MFLDQIIWMVYDYALGKVEVLLHDEQSDKGLNLILDRGFLLCLYYVYVCALIFVQTCLYAYATKQC